MRPIDYNLLPDHIQEGMKLYIEKGVEPGGFCKAALSGKLIEAYCKADRHNLERMGDIINWLNWACPAAAHGSVHRVNTWIRRGGIEGMKKNSAEQVDNPMPEFLESAQRLLLDGANNPWRDAIEARESLGDDIVAIYEPINHRLVEVWSRK